MKRGTIELHVHYLSFKNGGKAGRVTYDKNKELKTDEI